MISCFETLNTIDPSPVFPFWEELDDELKKLIYDLPVYRCPDGEQLLINPENRDGCFMVLEGCLRVFISSQSGREFTLFQVHPGNGCGLIPFENLVHPLVQAIGDTVYVYLPLATMAALMCSMPQLSSFFQFSVTGNLQEIVDNIESAFFSPLISGVAHTILSLCPEDSSTLKITHEQIANHIGTTREMVTREIRKLKADGIIQSGRGSITVLDRPRLEEMASSHVL